MGRQKSAGQWAEPAAPAFLDSRDPGRLRRVDVARAMEYGDGSAITQILKGVDQARSSEISALTGRHSLARFPHPHAQYCSSNTLEESSTGVEEVDC